MDPALGVKSKVLVDLETSWGVEKGTPAGFNIHVYEESVSQNQGLLPNESIGGGHLNPLDPAPDASQPDGPLRFIMSTTFAPYLGKLMFGNLSTTGSADPWTHVNKISTEGPLSLVLQKSFNVAGTQYYVKANGARVARLTIPLDPVGFWLWQADMMTKSVADPSTSNYSATPTNWTALTPMDLTKLLAADVKIDGSAVGYVRKGSITIDFGLEGGDVGLGTVGNRASLVTGLNVVGSTFTLAVDSAAVFTLLSSYGTPHALSFKLTQATNRSVQLELPRTFLSRQTPPLKGKGGVFMDITATPVYDGTAVSAFVMTTVNDQSGAVYV